MGCAQGKAGYGKVEACQGDRRGNNNDDDDCSDELKGVNSAIQVNEEWVGLPTLLHSAERSVKGLRIELCGSCQSTWASRKYLIGKFGSRASESQFREGRVTLGNLNGYQGRTEVVVYLLLFPVSWVSKGPLSPRKAKCFCVPTFCLRCRPAAYRG